ncbi:MAG: FG-GAP-like repeat-containing protein, partial [Mariprofundaceae bacterium]|nr:FG-GAP-like repeat-containing protein [Mariprofundaceae bacterium]
LKDVNGDGWPVVIAACLGVVTPGGVGVWLNNQHGGWVEGFGPTAKGQYTGLTVADLNADGYQDIIASARGGFGSLRTRSNRFLQAGGVQVWLGDGGGHWDSRLLPVEGDAESVTVGDVNADGRPDVVAGLFRNGVRLWMNEGDDWDVESVIDTGTWGAVRIADVEGDGVANILAASRDGDGVALWRWGGGFFDSGSVSRVGGLLPEHGSFFGIDVADVFADGRLQVAAARADGRVEVWSKRQPDAAGQDQADARVSVDAHVDLLHISENKVFKTVDGVIEYRIGPGDEVSITMWQGGKSTEYKLLVKADGTVSLPYFEAARIEGMTAPEVDVFMTKTLSRYLRHPRIDVLVLSMNSKRVRVFGLGSGTQTNPSGGTFYLKGRETLVDLMSRMGTPAKDADFSR